MIRLRCGCVRLFPEVLNLLGDLLNLLRRRTLFCGPFYVHGMFRVATIAAIVFRHFSGTISRQHMSTVQLLVHFRPIKLNTFQT